jgi:hypothetical protein
VQEINKGEKIPLHCPYLLETSFLDELRLHEIALI